MAWFILLMCIPAGFGIYLILSRIWCHLVRPLTERIPTGRQYRPGIHPRTQERRR